MMVMMVTWNSGLAASYKNINNLAAMMKHMRSQWDRNLGEHQSVTWHPGRCSILPYGPCRTRRSNWPSKPRTAFSRPPSCVSQCSFGGEDSKNEREPSKRAAVNGNALCCQRCLLPLESMFALSLTGPAPPATPYSTVLKIESDHSQGSTCKAERKRIILTRAGVQGGAVKQACAIRGDPGSFIPPSHLLSLTALCECRHTAVEGDDNLRR